MRPFHLALLALATACSTPTVAPAPQVAVADELVHGLRVGERALPIVERVRDDAFAELRVVDAATCLPLEGARVETWTEDGTPPARLPILVDDARTGRDGSARVRWRAGEGRASNFRVSKGGYESLVTSTPLGETVWLHRAVPLRGRVLDLDLAPVTDAVVRTRQCCAHAISAASTRTDADGFFVLEDVPIGEDEGCELEVLHERTTAWKELEPLVLRQIGEHDPLTAGRGAAVLVARSVPWRARLLDVDGKPLAHRRVGSIAWRPSVAAWTDANGVCELPVVDAFSLDVETMDAGAKLHWNPSTLPGETLVDLRLIESAPAAEAEPEPSTPHVERSLELAVPSSSVAGGVVAGVVQTGARGLVVRGVDLMENGPHRLFVPPGPATTIACLSTIGELRRARVAQGTETATADLTREECVLRPAFTAHEGERVRESIATFGLPLDAQDVHGTAWIAGEGSKELDAEGLELPRGRWYFAILSARGFCPVHVLRRAGDPPTTRAVRSARVRFTGDVKLATAFGRELDEAENAEHAYEYAGVPGPLRVFVTHADGTCVRIDVELAPGDERELEVP